MRSCWLPSVIVVSRAVICAIAVGCIAVTTPTMQATTQDGTAAGAQTPPAAGTQGAGRGRGQGQGQAQGLLGRPSPPQPQQQQGLDYFVGTWNFTWTGRESALTAGPRTGSIVYVRSATGLDFSTRGTVDGGGAYQERGTFTWTAATRMLGVEEHLAAGVDVRGQGDWTSPIAIQFLSQPLSVGGKALQLRRTYSIVSGITYTVTEELSTGGGPFARLGTGTFVKQ